MSPRFAAGTLVEYAGARWQVECALGAEAILLRSDTGAEVSADPLKIRLPEITEPIGPLLPPIDELRYSAAEGATRRAMIATSGASVSSGETAGGRLSPVFAASIGSVMTNGFNAVVFPAPAAATASPNRPPRPSRSITSRCAAPCSARRPAALCCDHRSPSWQAG
jgi:hypothetical protein